MFSVKNDTAWGLKVSRLNISVTSTSRSVVTLMPVSAPTIR